MPALQAVWWLLTIRHSDWVPWLPPSVRYIRGQLERGQQADYLHWQVCLAMERKTTAHAVKQLFPTAHIERSRSAAAREYVWKEDTRIDNTQFELGTLPHRRNESSDWDRIWEAAKTGKLLDIPADERVRHYRTLKQIEKDYLKPEAVVREVFVFWGAPKTGKSRRAWEEAGLDAYPKDPCTKVCSTVDR